MTRAICIGVAIAAVTTAVLGQGRDAGGRQSGAPGDAAPAAAQAEMRRVLDTYCVGCHSSAVRAGGVAFDTLTLDTVHEHADVWEAAVRKLRGRLMPPPGSRQPDQREIDAFVAWLEAKLDSARGGRAAGPVAGHVPAQRLTRTEFATAVNDLLGIELDAAQLLPAEIEVDGFDNIAAALSVSPSFLDQYVAAARLAARLAVGEPVPKVASAHYPQPLTGRPAGSRRRAAARHARRDEVPAPLPRRRRVPVHDSRPRRRSLHPRGRDPAHADRPGRRPRGVSRAGSAARGPAGPWTATARRAGPRS